eukprot:TRINITY_DN30807_c0_g1_i1.p1 TRINITY_DN30807_c0_g1~~TRINITY_DN30807_c0_g1_i1.p1  ORF type:complete len:298 (+),score=72.48 TRINITY_DN30807_c0_g1_i1:131-895(+)
MASAHRRVPDAAEVASLGYVLRPPAPDAPRRLVVALDLHDTLVRVRPQGVVDSTRGAPQLALVDGWERMSLALANVPGAEAVHTMRGPEGDTWEVKVRAGCGDLLAFVGSRCEGVLWTVGGPRYVSPVLAAMDPVRALAAVVMSRTPQYDEHGREGGSSDWALLPDCKPLAMLNRCPDTVVQVDDRPEYLRCNPDSGIIVPAYFGQPDAVLPKLTSLLEYTAGVVEEGGTVAQALATAPPHLARQREEGGVLVE